MPCKNRSRSARWSWQRTTANYLNINLLDAVPDFCSFSKKWSRFIGLRLIIWKIIVRVRARRASGKTRKSRVWFVRELRAVDWLNVEFKRLIFQINIYASMSTKVTQCGATTRKMEISIYLCDEREALEVTVNTMWGSGWKLEFNCRLRAFKMLMFWDNNEILLLALFGNFLIFWK